MLVRTKISLFAECAGLHKRKNEMVIKTMLTTRDSTGERVGPWTPSVSAMNSGRGLET